MSPHAHPASGVRHPERVAARRGGPVLLVEDDDDIAELIEEVLASEGFRVVVARHGRIALDAVAREPPSLILLDMRMPVMDGWTFAAELRAREPSPPPIVVVTAAASPAGRAADVDADGWVAKPFDIDELLDLVRRYADPAPGAGPDCH